MDVTIRHRFGTRQDAICNLKHELRDARERYANLRRELQASIHGRHAAERKLEESDRRLFWARYWNAMLVILLAVLVEIWLYLQPSAFSLQP